MGYAENVFDGGGGPLQWNMNFCFAKQLEVLDIEIYNDFNGVKDEEAQ